MTTSAFIAVFVLLTITKGSQALEKWENVKFYHLTEHQSENAVQITHQNVHQYLSKDAEIIFLLHGWTQNYQHHSYTLLKNAYLSRQDKFYNVVAIDYAEAANQAYHKAIQDAVKVGRRIGDFIIFMESRGFSLKNIHMVGHSLGAHIAGFAGKYIDDKLERKIHRITGLDPAGPFFQGYIITSSNRLLKHDADIVFVVHTDRLMFGVKSSCGTIDVYPNGGGNQPGCPDYYRGEILFCNHHKSYELLADAVENPGTLFATKCMNYTLFDDGDCRNNRRIDLAGDFTRDDEGNYYLHTNANKPYAKDVY